MRTDSNYASAATSSVYIEWLMKDKLGLTDKEWKTYNFLINSLAKIEFIWIHPQDENRAIDGMELREQFSRETGLYLDGSSGLTAKCSMLELLAALSIKVENRIMRNVDLGDRTSKWFFAMIDNMGCTRITNKNWKYDDEAYIRSVCNAIIYRDYKSNGEGGLFPLKNESKNWKNEEIWVQCMAFLRENYPNDDSGLELYKDS